jgi:hypothetical protein
MVPKEHFDRHHLALVNHQSASSKQRGKNTVNYAIMHYRAPNHLSEPTWFYWQAEEHFELEK